MNDRIKELFEEAQCHESSRKLYGAAYEEATGRFRGHCGQRLYGVFALQQPSAGGERGTAINSSVADAGNSHPSAATKSRASVALALFDGLDKNHDGILDQSELSEGLKHSKRPQEALALELLKDNYDLIHKLKTCNLDKEPPPFDFGISRENLRELDELEVGTDSLYDVVVRADILKGEKLGAFAGTVIGGAVGDLASSHAFPARLAGAGLGAVLGSGLGALAGTAASVFDFYGTNRFDMQNFLKSVPTARSANDDDSLSHALTDFVSAPTRANEIK